MTEAEFWKALEYRVSRELRMRPSNLVRFLWCDGFAPDDVQHDAARVVGYAHISEDDGLTFEQYRFQLWLNPRRREDSDWTGVLEGLGDDWLSIDRDGKTLEIRPRISH